MAKHFTYTLAASVAIAVSASLCVDAAAATDGTASRSREEIARVRASRPRTAPAQKPAKAPLQAGDKPLYGVMYGVYDGSMLDFYGPIQVSDQASQHIKLGEFDMIPFSGVYFDGKYLQSFYDNWTCSGPITYVVYDAETWEPLTGNMSFMSSTGVTPDILPCGLTYDHTTGNIYGSFYANAENFVGTDDSQFGVFDLSNALSPVTIINRSLPERMRAYATDYDGQVYGFGMSGQLYKINKLTGEATPTVKVTTLYSAEDDAYDPFLSIGRESIAVDWETGLFYFSYSDGMADSYITTIDPETGETNLVAEYSYMKNDWDCGDLITGLFFKQTYVATEVIPAQVADFNINVSSTALSAGVTFTMPATDTNGEAITGNYQWHITDGATELATGTAEAGSVVNTEVAVAEPGFCSLVVYTTLNGKDSAPATDRKFFGPDTPVVSGTPTVRAAGNQLTVTWTAAYSENGGQLDPVSYNVTRMPDNVVVGQNVTGVTFVDEIESDIKTRYYYVVKPVAGNVEGQEVTSRAIFVGKYFGLPHHDIFNDQALLLEYPIIDNNNDDVIWDYSSRKNAVSGEAGVASIATNPKPDDYLLIGPFKMEAGSAYTFHMAADGHNFNERVAVYVGTDPADVKSFSTQLIAPTTLTPITGLKNIDASFEPETSGDYYFGIHACTEGTGQFLYLYEVTVKAVGGDCPSAPQEIDAIPGATTAEIKFTLPSKAVDGSDLESLTAANVYRDSELIGTLTDDVKPGAVVSFTDTDNVADGFHNYTVTAVNMAGEGKSSHVQLYRGLDYPGKPTNLRIWEDLEKPGLMHVSLEHPQRGYYGGYVNPDNIWYLVNYLMLGTGSGTLDLGYGKELTFQIPGDINAQDIVGASVYGRNDKGVVANSTNWTTQTAYVGPALSLPLHESWAAQGQKSGIWGGQSVFDNVGGFETYWDIRDGSYTAAKPQDNDGGMMAIDSEYDGGGKRVLTPRVTLEGAENPTLVFYYRYTTDALDFNLEAFVDDKPAAILRKLDLTAENAGAWQRVEVNLNEFKGCKYLQFGFTAYGNKSQEFICLDNVTISDLVDYDLSTAAFSVPSKADVNAEVEVSLDIRNNGGKDVKGSDYSVKFFKNGELLEEVAGQDISSDAQLNFTVVDVPLVTDPASTEYYAEISFADDSRPSDNTSARASMRIVVSEYPTVTDLKAVNADGVELSWSDPDMSLIPGVSVTESFEAYESFIIDNIGPWTLYDGDKCRTVVLATTMGVLDYPNIGEPMAWQVIDPAEANIFLSAWDPRSGKKILASLQASADQTRELYCDDWLISPELNGAEQVISFYGRAGNGGASAPEIFDFMVSSKSNAVADFTPMATSVEVPYSSSEWFEYTYRVPAGTRYFAIVHKSFDKVAMLIDDITYIPAGSSPVQLDLQGFNVYRDGKRLNDEPIVENFYLDRDVELGNDYTYYVTPVYDKGEAALSNAVTIKVEASVGDVAGYEINVSGHTGFIRVEGGMGEEVSVYTLAGVCVASVKANGTVDIPVSASGIYLVKAGNAVAKIAVR